MPRDLSKMVESQYAVASSAMAEELDLGPIGGTHVLAMAAILGSLNRDRSIDRCGNSLLHGGTMAEEAAAAAPAHSLALRPCNETRNYGKALDVYV